MLIKGEECNRVKWRIGMVEHLILGRNGVIRGAQLSAGKTHIERPLQLLYPLEFTFSRPQQRRGETLGADARDF